MSLSLVGTEIEHKYRIVSEIGAGAFGTVYKAEQCGLSRFVAIKVLNSNCLDETENYLRFKQEAKVLSLLNHEHIVVIYSFGILANQAPYMVMEYLEGQSLAAFLLNEGKCQTSLLLQIARQCAEAMAFAHSKGIVHRDLKPQNIVLLTVADSVCIKILDFGLAKLFKKDFSATGSLTQTGTLIGTAEYMSPEACLGQKVDFRSDLYSLGCVLYQCLAGHAPFSADSSVAVLYKQCNESPASILGLTSRIDERLELLILKCLQKEPDRRYQNAEELLKDISYIENDQEPKFVIEQSVKRKSNAQSDKQHSPNIPRSVFLVLIALSASVYLGKIWNESNVSQRSTGSITSFELREKLMRIGANLEKTSDFSTIRSVYRSSLAELENIDLDKCKMLDNNEQKAKQRLMYLISQLKGMCAIGLGDKDLALSSFLDALKYSKNSQGHDTDASINPYTSLATVYEIKGQNAAAEATAETAVSLVEERDERLLPSLGIPDMPGLAVAGDRDRVAIILLCEHALKRKDWTNARKYAHRLDVINRGKLEPEFVFISARILEGEGQIEKANALVADFAKVVDQRSQPPSDEERNQTYPYNRIAKWYLSRNRKDLAQFYFQKTVDLAKRLHLGNGGHVAVAIENLSFLRTESRSATTK